MTVSFFLSKKTMTDYNGELFRTRTEARWAVFFDSLKEEWEREPDDFVASFTPSFFLPRLDCYLDIKRREPTAEDDRRYSEFAILADRPIAIAWNLPFVAREYEGRYGKGYVTDRLQVCCGESTDNGGGLTWIYRSFWAIDKKGKLCLCCNNDRDSRCFWTPSSWEPYQSMKQVSQIASPISDTHVIRAKSAEFESDGDRDIL